MVCLSASAQQKHHRNTSGFNFDSRLTHFVTQGAHSGIITTVHWHQFGAKDKFNYSNPKRFWAGKKNTYSQVGKPAQRAGMSC